MQFIDPELEKYVDKHTEAESEILSKINRETWLKVLMPRMLSGHLQGRILSIFSKMIKPQFILEIGTFTGYSAICLSEGLMKDGRLITIDINEELESMVKKNFQEAGIAEKTEFIVGNALEIISGLNYEFDLVFIDADKENYLNYFNLVLDKIKKGGYIIADNVLWSGKVLLPEKEMDNDTKAINDFNNAVQGDPRIENVMIPVRDGLMVIRKK